MSEDEPIVWTGDIEDDCVAKWRGLGAHAEYLNRYSWHAMVWVINPNAKVGADNLTLFHADENDVNPKTGPAARKLCEWLMRTHVAERDLSALRERLRLAEAVREAETKVRETIKISSHSSDGWIEEHEQAHNELDAALAAWTAATPPGLSRNQHSPIAAQCPLTEDKDAK